MEGVQFLWIAWSIWLYVIFFCQGERAKSLTIMLLFLITLFPYTFIVGDVVINGAFLLCLFYVSYLLINENWLRKSYYFLLSLMITCASVAFQLFAIFDPVSILFNRTYLLAIVLVALVLTLPMRREQRIPVLAMGFLQSEFIYKDILAALTVERIIGDAAFFDVLSLMVLLVVVWNAFEAFSLRMSESVSQNVPSSAKRSVGEY